MAFSFIYLFVALGIDPRALHILGKLVTTKLHHQLIFYRFYFETQCH